MRLLATHTVSSNDYYERNKQAKTLCYVPIYFFDIEVVLADRIKVEFKSASDCLLVKRVLVLAPNGRVVSSCKNKTFVNFNAEQIGKYTLKCWIVHKCEERWTISELRDLRNGKNNNGGNMLSGDVEKDYLDEHSAKFDVNIYSHNFLASISYEKTGIRVFSLLGCCKGGSIFKGEMLESKCGERYIPAKGQSRG